MNCAAWRTNKNVFSEWLEGHQGRTSSARLPERNIGVLCFLQTISYVSTSPRQDGYSKPETTVQGGASTSVSIKPLDVLNAMSGKFSDTFVARIQDIFKVTLQQKLTFLTAMSTQTTLDILNKTLGVYPAVTVAITLNILKKTLRYIFRLAYGNSSRYF